MRILFALISLTVLTAVRAADVYTDPATGLSVLSTEIELPAEGFWYLHPKHHPREHLGFAFLLEPEEIYDLQRGQRTQALRERRAEQERRRLLSRAGSILTHRLDLPENRTPANWTDLDLSDHPELHEAFATGTLALVPGVPLRIENREEAQPLLVELKPLRNDGKHWVRNNHWRVERQDIDPALLQKHDWEITPSPLPALTAESLTYTLFARVFDPEIPELTLTLTNDHPKAEREIVLPVRGATDSRENFDLWAEERTYVWLDWDNRIARMWAERAPDLYGIEIDLPRGPGRNTGRTASIMNVFGGDAAIRETLQLQNLVSERPGADEEATIPLEDVRGVTVRSHNYAELLGDTQAPTVDLAAFCPEDRFFVWFPQPLQLADLLEGTDGILGRILSTGGPEILDHEVLDKHLNRLDLNRTILRETLKQDILSETALILPDLFLREGTDITSISRVRNPLTIDLYFSLLDRDPNAPEVHRWQHEDLLVLSSSATELQQVKELVLAGGENSLGTSAEFRYMLTQSPPTDKTLAYIYFSDSFIRRLTGPEVKIGQYRRLHARAELERLAAGRLLYQLDQRQTAPDIETLIETGYAPKLNHLNSDTLTWVYDRLTDPVWGSAARMATLLENVPTHVTPSEQKAYDTYRNQYESFWQQFFDPISIHIEKLSEEEMQTTVFILPLINSSIYDTVRGWFDPSPDRPLLRRPVLDPPPIAMISLNLSEPQWLDIIEGLADGFENAIGIDLPIWEYIGPGLHMGLADSDAVLTFGSGDLLDIFSARNGVRNNEMVWLPMAVSLFTRPVVLAVDLTDPDRMLEALRATPTGQLADQRNFLGFTIDLNQITGQDRWLLRIQLGGVLHLSFSLEVQDRYLVLSNLPLTYAPAVTGQQTDGLRDAAVLLQPHAIQATGPGFATAALDRARQQTHKALGTLSLFHQAGSPTLERALSSARSFFGFTPVHPSPGEFVWTPGEPLSSTFGHIYEGRQPALGDADVPGLLPPLHHLDLSMQLENEGLRTRIRWQTLHP